MFHVHHHLTRACRRAALGAMLAGVCLPALAGWPLSDEPEKVNRAVSVKGLDLTSPADQAVLRSRLLSAAREVCWEALEDESTAASETDACVAKALADAEPQVQPIIAAAQSRTLYAVGPTRP